MGATGANARKAISYQPFCLTFFRPGTLPDQVKLCVFDSGIGISEPDRLRSFDRFLGAGDQQTETIQFLRAEVLFLRAELEKHNIQRLY